MSATPGATSGSAPFEIAVDNLSSGVDELEWNFGDGTVKTTTGVEKRVAHSYTKAGEHTVQITGRKKKGPETYTHSFTVSVAPGPISRVVVEPAELSLAPKTETKLTATAYDQFDNVARDAAFEFKIDGKAGAVDAQGLVVTGEKAGAYSGAVEVTATRASVTQSRRVNVTIVPGPLARVSLEPLSATVAAASSQIFTARALDAYDNVIPDVAVTLTAVAQAGSIDAQGKLTAAERAGTFSDAVEARATQGGTSHSTKAKVVVAPGPLAKVNMPKEATLAAGASGSFTAQALDFFGNVIPDATVTYTVAPSAGKIDEKGTLKAGEKAGSYERAVTASVVQAGVERATSMNLTVVPAAPAKVTVDLPSTPIRAGGTLPLLARVFDAFGNPITDAKVAWTAQQGAGEPNGRGALAVGTKAGSYAQGVTASVGAGEAQVSATAGITVLPAAVKKVTIVQAQVAAGSSEQLKVVAVDQYGNEIKDARLAWQSVDRRVGTVTEAGVLTVGKIVGTYAGAVQVAATYDGATVTTTADLGVIPAALDKLHIAPGNVEIGIGVKQQFVAAGVDRFGNRIAKLPLTWEVAAGGGTIDAVGAFTAGTTPGAYAKTVKVTAGPAGAQVSAAATVTVLGDRIAYFRAKDADSPLEIYMLDVTTRKTQRVSAPPEAGPVLSWSPDGRRLAYDICDAAEDCGIALSNDDGSWEVMISASSDLVVAWSPVGDHLAFASFRDGNHEIYVMDVDGANPKRLTHTAQVEAYPTWSPDGKSLAFISTRDGNSEIYTMDADGSNVRRLTNSNDLGHTGVRAVDSFPAWSPDGEEIAFESRRTGSYAVYVMKRDGTNVRKLTGDGWSAGCASWSPSGEEIVYTANSSASQTNYLYVMKRDGTEQRRLTTDTATELCRRWAPRKQAVPINEAFLPLPLLTHAEPLTVQALTAKVRPSVVRVETDLGMGSGAIISSDGLVLTNNHVIAGAKTIKVTLDDKRDFTGTVLRRDLVRDLAVIKIDATGLPALEMGSLEEGALGSQIIVAGYPLGSKDLTVTSGLVSSIKADTGRNILWVQTDSAVNPGNSGGPMLDMHGRLVGIVSSKLVGAAVENVGFAISVNTVQIYLPALTAG